eukprot:Pgem_evm1s3382
MHINILKCDSEGYDSDDVGDDADDDDGEEEEEFYMYSSSQNINSNSNREKLPLKKYKSNGSVPQEKANRITLPTISRKFGSVGTLSLTSELGKSDSLYVDIETNSKNISNNNYVQRDYEEVGKKGKDYEEIGNGYPKESDDYESVEDGKVRLIIPKKTNNNNNTSDKQPRARQFRDHRARHFELHRNTIGSLPESLPTPQQQQQQQPLPSPPPLLPKSPQQETDTGNHKILQRTRSVEDELNRLTLTSSSSKNPLANQENSAPSISNPVLQFNINRGGSLKRSFSAKSFYRSKPTFTTTTSTTTHEVNKQKKFSLMNKSKTKLAKQ